MKSMMKMIRSTALLFVIAATVGFTTSQAQASILFGPSLFYTSSKTTDQTGFLGGNSGGSSLLGEAKLGYLIEGTMIYIGGLYSFESNSSDSGAKMTGGNYGPTVGIFNGAFSLLATYLIGGSRTYTSGAVENKVSSGSGIRVDVSYVAGLTGSIGLGPQLTYRDIKYAKSTPGTGAETSNSYDESVIYPSIIMWFRF